MFALSSIFLCTSRSLGWFVQWKLIGKCSREEHQGTVTETGLETMSPDTVTRKTLGYVSGSSGMSMTLWRFPELGRSSVSVNMACGCHCHELCQWIKTLLWAQSKVIQDKRINIYLGGGTCYFLSYLVIAMIASGEFPGCTGPICSFLLCVPLEAEIFVRIHGCHLLNKYYTFLICDL